MYAPALLPESIIEIQTPIKENNLSKVEYVYFNDMICTKYEHMLIRINSWSKENAFWLKLIWMKQTKLK